MLQRRNFLRLAATLTCSVSHEVAFARPVQDRNTESVGTHIYKSLKWTMIRDDQSVLERFRMLKGLGYDGIELTSPGGVEVDLAKAARDAAELPIEGIVNSTHWKTRHSDPNPEVRQQALANMQTAMRYAAAVGADSVLLVPGKVTDTESENHDQVWRRSHSHLKQLLPLAEQLGVQILIENVGNGFCETPELLAQYIDEIGHPLVAIHFDLGNFIRLGPPADWIRYLGRRIRKLDVKDRRTDNSKTPIGSGDADWPEVRRALLEIKYKGWAAAEVTGGGEDRLKEILQRMNNVLGTSDGKPEQLKRR